MNKNILFWILTFYWWPGVWAQTGILQLKQNDFNSYVNLDLNLKDDLMAQGIAGEATLEFWIKSTQANNEWVLTDLNQDAQNFIVSMDNEHQLTINRGSSSKEIDLIGEVASNNWHHVALAFSSNGQVLEIYVNGVEKGEFDGYVNIGRDLYFFKRANSELHITEIRSWSRRRTPSQIADNQWRTYVDLSPSALQSLEDNDGLVFCYGKNNFNNDLALSGIGQLTKSEWPSITTSDKKLSFISGNQGYSYATISETSEHPILNLGLILLTAGKGTQESSIELSWPHVNGVDGYNIFRNDALIGTETADGVSISSLIPHSDAAVLPNEIQQYRVEGFGNPSDPLSIEGTNTGFIFSNGVISGNIKTESEIFVESVEVRVTTDNGILPGNSISFSSESKAVTIPKVDVFRNKEALTIQFWYKGNEEATPFEIGGMKVHFEENSLSVSNGDGSSFLQNIDIANDGNWHQYTISLSPQGGKVYEDAMLKTEASEPFSIDLSSVQDFRINTSAPSSDYQLDELKIWSGVLSQKQIAARHDHILSGNESNLLLYYQFDLEDSKNIYNRAEANIGAYIGTDNTTSFSYSNEQPELVYGGFTDINGNYEISGINAGLHADGLTLTITAIKPNHEFRPASRGVTIKRSLERTQYSKEADFTDISSLPVSGRIFYSENGGIHPVPSGKTLLIDGAPFAGASTGTDASGTYNISSALGLHTFEVNNTAVTRHFGNQSLSVKGAQAVSEKLLNETEQITLSGFVKRSESTSTLQTIIELGDVSLQLKDNNRIAVKIGDQEILVSQVLTENEFSFFSISLDKTTQHIVMLVENHFQEDDVSGLASASFSGKLMLGSSGTIETLTDSFEGYLDQIEYRTSYYNQETLAKIKSGEFIENDEENLLLSYSFDEKAGSRAISLTNLGWDNFLNLTTEMQYSVEFPNDYRRKFKYEYVASNVDFNPTGDQYSLNMISPVSNLDFQNTTRYGFIGNIVIPCGNSAGSWVGSITRTDVISPVFSKEINSENFNSDETVFKIDGLLPGSYQVQLTNVTDPTRTLISPILDISMGWQSYDFEYRNPLEVNVQIFESIEGKPGDLIHPSCTQKYVLDAGIDYIAQVDVFEQYNEDSCPVGEATVTLGGDMGMLIQEMNTAGNIPSLETDSNGQLLFRFTANKPNFLGEYFRKMHINVSHDGRTRGASPEAYITGAVKESNNFTIEKPRLLAVLHDPPGDNSYATLEESLSIQSEYSFSEGTDISFDAGFGSGNAGNISIGGGLVGIAQRIFKFAVNFGVGSESKFSYRSTGGNSREYTLNSSISTSSNDDMVGARADVYVGVGMAITFGTGKRLEVVDCTPSVINNAEVADITEQTEFVYTHLDIKNTIIPYLELLKSEAGDSDDRDYDDEINVWKGFLASNTLSAEEFDELSSFDDESEKLTGADNLYEGFDAIEEVPENISFSGGAIQNYTYVKKQSESNGDQVGGSSGINNEQKFEVETNNSTYDWYVKSSIIGLRDNVTNNTDSKEGGFSFTLADDDAGDQFNVEIRKNPGYSTPIFRTKAGQSSCPFELGTQPREGVELITDKTDVFTFIGEPAAYNLQFRNTQIARDNSPKRYLLSYKRGDQENGPIIRLNGDPLGNGLAIDFNADNSFYVGVEQLLSGQLTISAPDHLIGDVDYENIPIVLSSPCETAGFAHTDQLDEWEAELENLGIHFTDTVYLSAHFRAPCVEQIEIQSPGNQWIVNNQDEDILMIQFKIPGLTTSLIPGSLTKVLIEYAVQGNNTPLLLDELAATDLQAQLQSDGFIHHEMDVSEIADGEYQIRLTPQCGIGEEIWRKSNPTDWISGSIYRISPVITQVFPEDNTIMTSGTISASYDRSLNPEMVNSLNVSLRGFLGGLDYEPTSASFDQLTDYIEIPDQDVFDLTGAYTIEFWIYPTAFNDVPIIEKGSNFEVRLTSDGKIFNGWTHSEEPLPPFKWTHVAVVYDGQSVVNTYLDGRNVVNVQNATPIVFTTNQDPIKIGNGFLGRLDEVRIWNKSLSAAEIITNRTKMLLGNEEDLNAYYVLDNIGLEADGFQEAIRDFTGNSKFTTSNGLSWVENTAAAPIEIERVIQDVPIDAILSAGNQVLIVPKPTFSEFDLEGAELTASITGNIEDVYGNKAKGRSWRFVMNKNQVKWSRNNLLIDQPAGTVTSFSMDLSNEGAINSTYEFEDLPAWLSVSNDAGNGQLPYGNTNTVSFEIAEWLNSGQYETHVKVTILDTDGIRLGVESFLLTVNVNCEKPDFTFNHHQYPDLIALVALVTIDGQLSFDLSDEVAVYINDEIRGNGNLQKFGDQYLVSLNVFGEFSENNASLHFKIWDHSTCKLYDGILESYSYNAGSSIGSFTSPASLTTGKLVSKTYSLLAKGSHWVSFNLKDASAETLSLSSISGLHTGDYLIDKNGFQADYDESSGWSGSLIDLNYKESYFLELSQQTNLTFKGVEVSVNTDIALADGTNWIGYIPDDAMTTERALISLTNTSLADGDLIKGREGHAEFIKGVWKGSLTHLTPGRGYRLQVSNQGVLNYYGIANNSSSRNIIGETLESEHPIFMTEEASVLRWEYAEERFPEVMYFSGIVDQSAIIEEEEHLLVGAFVNGECRGVAVAQKIADEFHYFLTVYGNFDDEQVMFKVTSASSTNVYEAKNKVAFKGGESVGSYREPFVWEISKDDIDTQELRPEVYIYPNPFIESTTLAYMVTEPESKVTIEVYNLSGRKVKELVRSENHESGIHRLAFKREGLPAGLYFCHLLIGDHVEVKKVLIED